MKTLILSLKLFRKHFSSNIFLLLSLSVIITLFVIVLNISDISRLTVDTLNNSKYRIIYCMNPYINRIIDSRNYPGEEYPDGFDLEKARIDATNSFKNELINKCVNIKGFKGVSMYANTGASFENDGNYVIDVRLIDKLTASTIRYPLSQGKWITDVKGEDNYYPCIIGGINASNYSTGDKITIYIDSKLNSGTGIKYNFIISGILANPIQLLDPSVINPSLDFPVSSLYDDYTNRNIILYTTLPDISGINYFIQCNCFAYFDKTLREEELSDASKILDSPYSITDSQLISAESKKIKKNNESLLPFIGMLLVVAITGIIVMFMLNTIKTINEFSIYYLCGCSWKRSILISAISNSIFFLIAGIIPMIILKILYIIEHLPHIKPIYFITTKNLSIAVGLCIAISFFTFIIPFLILKKYNTVEHLKLD